MVSVDLCKINLYIGTPYHNQKTIYSFYYYYYYYVVLTVVLNARKCHVPALCARFEAICKMNYMGKLRKIGFL